MSWHNNSLPTLCAELELLKVYPLPILMHLGGDGGQSVTFNACWTLAEPGRPKKPILLMVILRHWPSVDFPDER